MNTKGFTLLELYIVLVIISILATLSVMNFAGSTERVADREAISSLKILQSAQKGYFVEMGRYYPNSTINNVSDIMAINNNLSVSLSNNTNRNWNYTVYSSGCVQARRFSSDQRYFNLTNSSDAEPSAAMTCP
ncbi:MAG: type II secretion system protein [Candidatus Omnitrophota bacterium]